MEKKVVIIDNYDSFTYNLVHIVEELLDNKVTVVRNDEFELSDLEIYEYIILSPGPGIPEEAGLLKDVIKHYKSTKKIMGVCLGLQAIGEVYGAELLNLKRVWHGMRTSMIRTEAESIQSIIRTRKTEQKSGTRGIGKYFERCIQSCSNSSLCNRIPHEGNISG